MPSRHEKLSSKRFVAKGEAVVGGFAIGAAFYFEDVLTRELAFRILSKSQARRELRRLQKAMRKAQSDLAKLKSKIARDIDAQHAEIFHVHRLILQDVDLFKEMEKELKKRLINAEQIVQSVFRRREMKLRRVKDKTIRQRADDIADVGRRLLEALLEVKGNKFSDLPVDSVVFAQRLLPSDTASLTMENAKAIVTVEGSHNSHSAILASAMDIPFVAKVDRPITVIPANSKVIVDGENGKVIVNPSSAELDAYPKLIQKRMQKKLNIVRRIRDETLELKGKPIKVSANVSSLREVQRAADFYADGIGLYRTEPIYMGKQNLPVEEDLYAHLKKSLAPLRGREVTFRLLDVGGDKTLPFIDIVELKDAALGLNGIRLLFRYPALLRMQLRVFLRLSTELDVRVLVPMVSLPRDMTEVRRYLSEEKRKLRKEKIPFNDSLPIGAMIETPAAVFSIDEILKLSDFVGLGTNDLVQYVMAAGREKPDVADYYEAGNYLILDALKSVLDKAESKGKECTLCGELGGNLKFTENLLDLGLRDFSVQPALIPSVKNRIYRILSKKARLSSV